MLRFFRVGIWVGPKFSVEKITIYGKIWWVPKKLMKKSAILEKKLQVGTQRCPKQIFGIMFPQIFAWPPPWGLPEIEKT